MRILENRYVGKQSRSEGVGGSFIHLQTHTGTLADAVRELDAVVLSWLKSFLYLSPCLKKTVGNIQCHLVVESPIESPGGGQTEPGCSLVAMKVRSLSDDQSASYTNFHQFPCLKVTMFNVLYLTHN